MRLKQDESEEVSSCCEFVVNRLSIVAWCYKLSKVQVRIFTNNNALVCRCEHIYMSTKDNKKVLVGWLFGFYGKSTFVGYLMSNPFSWK